MFQTVLNVCTLLAGIAALIAVWERFASLRGRSASRTATWRIGYGPAGGLLGGFAWFGWGLIGVFGVWTAVLGSGVLMWTRAPRLRSAATFVFRVSYFAMFWVTIEFIVAILLLLGVGGYKYTQVDFLMEPLVRTYPGLATAALGGVFGWFLEWEKKASITPPPNGGRVLRHFSPRGRSTDNSSRLP